MNYKSCPKCNGEMTILLDPNGSTAMELTCTVCGHTISRRDIAHPWWTAFVAASNMINEIERTKKHHAERLKLELAQLEAKRDIELANLFNPLLPQELEELSESIRQQFR